MGATDAAHKLVDEALAAGKVDADRARQFHRWVNIHGHFRHLVEHYKSTQKSFFKPDEISPDFVVSNDPPIFFKQMEESEFKNYDMNYPRSRWEGDFVVDYCNSVENLILCHMGHRQTGQRLPAHVTRSMIIKVNIIVFCDG